MPASESVNYVASHLTVILEPVRPDCPL